MSKYLFEKPLIRGTMLKRKSQFTALVDGSLRYGELQERVSQASPKMLAEHGFIRRLRSSLCHLSRR